MRKKYVLIKRTANLAAANGVVRVLGFIHRIWMARLLGVEGLGLYQMVAPTVMSAMALVTSGLPVSASRRMAAARGRGQDAAPLRRAAMQVAVAGSGLVALGLLLGALPLARYWLHQPQLTLAILCYVPAIMFQGICSIENAWCYAHGDTRTPATVILCEQLSRMALLWGLMYALTPGTPAQKATVGILSTAGGEAVALGVMRARVKRTNPPARLAPPRGERRALVGEAAWPTGGRFLASILQSILATQVPRRLIASGLSELTALEAIGTYTGVVIPMLMLPMILCSAMGTVLIPELAAAQASGSRRAGPICARSLAIAAASAAASIALLIPLAAPACRLFGQVEAAALLRLSLPLLIPMSIHHMLGSLLQGLGCQRRSLGCVLIADCMEIATTIYFTGRLAMPTGGMMLGMAVGETLSSILQSIALYLALKKKPLPCRGIPAAALQ
nr:oligosaccharide flippase family protein [bacterium]